MTRAVRSVRKTPPGLAMALRWALVVVYCGSPAAAETRGMRYDFRNDTCGWMATHSVESLAATPEGLSFVCTGPDPYVSGPADASIPSGVDLCLTIRMKSTGDSQGQIFYGRVFEAGREAGFQVEPDGQWHDYTVMLPPLERGSRLRVDPAAHTGEVTIAWMDLVPADSFIRPTFPEPRRTVFGEDGFRVAAGDLAVVHGLQHWNGFEVRVGGRVMATAHAHERLGIKTANGETYLAPAAVPLEATIHDDGSLSISVELMDGEGALGSLTRKFVPMPEAGAVSIATSLRVDRDCQAFHLPLLTLFPGLGTFGEHKTQAVLAGVEYLADEPSSSEADVRGRQANRRMVADFRMTLPMMALAADGQYLGMVWDRADHPVPVFDSPDRLYQSGAHLMGLWYPGVGTHRMEGDVSIMRPLELKADVPLSFTAILFGGAGDTVNPAVRHAIALRGGLPPVPGFAGGLPAAVNLLAHGWLDSELNVRWRWRHAVWHDLFGPAAVADAPGYMLWLAEHSDDPLLAKRLEEGAARGLEQLTPPDAYERSCSHVTRPFAPLLFGAIEAYAARRLSAARRSLSQFDDQGLIRYHPKPEGPDYAQTHWTDHANGLSATPLEQVLEAAAFTGDEDLIQRALKVLDAQCSAYARTVPRGAQTWEVPLHTPDILATARLLRCCTLAYQLTGDTRYIDIGREWAWTGVSMVYLDPPTPGPVGLYATIPVLGATNWTAPYWIGLPVQWCGLVYRSALQDFSRIDVEEGAVWAHLARGITRSGLQQTFPLDDQPRQGLLPDFYHLQAQRSDGPAINPGTLQAHLAEAYDATPIYTLRRVTPDGMLMHMPGAIGDVHEVGGRVEIPVTGWRSKPYWIRLVRVGDHEPDIRFLGGSVLSTQYDPGAQTLTLQVRGSGTLALTR